MAIDTVRYFCIAILYSFAVKSIIKTNHHVEIMPSHHRTIGMALAAKLNDFL
jgi:hypothetical protein